jgi:hypothetical protein
MATAFTIEQYNKLCDSISQGVLIVKYADKQVQYRSLAEMLQLKQLMEQALGINQQPKIKYAQQSKGLAWSDGRYAQDDPTFNNW